MSFLELAKARSSIRNYQDREIPREDLLRLLEAAQAAPSGGNCQPWQFYVIRNKPLTNRIVDEACKQEFLRQASALIVVCADRSRNMGRYGHRGESLYCLQDTAAAIQSILLCAQEMGLGTCWCGAFDEAALSRVLELPADQRPVAIITVGYAAQLPVKTKRRPVEEIAVFMD